MKTKKKLIFSLMLALAAFTLCVGVIFAATLSMSAEDETTVTASGTCGDNLTWTLTSDGTLTISGEGDMYDYYEVYVESGEGWESKTEYVTAPWRDSAEEITSVVIEDGVTSIGDGAFWDCTSLESVTIPDGVTEIGLGAFHYCDSLTSITIPESVTTIGDEAFRDCTSLTSATIPDSVTTIGDEAFRFCTSLTSVTIPDSVTEIGDSTFYECTSLTSITIPESVTTIGDDAFRDCTSLTSVTIGDSVTSIGENAFSGCTSLTSITIPDSVTEIGGSTFRYCTSLTNIIISDSLTAINYEMFYECTSLTSVTIPDSVTKIGYGAFSGCTSMTNITIPDSVTSIGESSFSGCTSLTAIDVDENNTSYCSIDGVLFDMDMTTLIVYPAGKADTSYTVPDSVTSIGGGAFNGCAALTSVTIPDGVTEIGIGTFSDCTSLESITIPDSVTTIGENAFGNCTSLTSVTIPDGVTEIELLVFEGCTSLTSITIPDSVTTIGLAAFSGCTSLTSISIPDSVTGIGQSAFFNTAYYNDEDNWENGVLYIGNWLIGADSEVVSGDYTIKSGTVGIVESAFSWCTSLTSVTIGGSVTTIEDYAFGWCTSLTEITFEGDAPSIIENEVFYIVTATVYYPADNATWTEDVMQDYGGTITWTSYTVETGGSDDTTTADDTTGAVTGTADDVEITTFAGASTGTLTFADDFSLTYSFTNTSTGSNNWENFVVEVYNGDGVYITVRADNYGWLANAGDSDTITFGDGLTEDEWAEWNAAMAAGSECTVTVEKDGAVITITCSCGGKMFTANACVAAFEDADLTVHLTGENVNLSTVSYAYTLASTSTVPDEPVSPQTGYAIASLSILAVVSGAALVATGAMKKRR